MNNLFNYKELWRCLSHRDSHAANLARTRWLLSRGRKKTKCTIRRRRPSICGLKTNLMIGLRSAKKNWGWCTSSRTFRRTSAACILNTTLKVKSCWQTAETVVQKSVSTTRVRQVLRTIQSCAAPTYSRFSKMSRKRCPYRRVMARSSSDTTVSLSATGSWLSSPLLCTTP